MARAVWQAPNASNDPPNRTNASEPPGKTPGPVLTEPSTEAPRASRRARRRARLKPFAEAPRASRWARGRACLESNPPPKRHERAVGQDAGHTSNHPPKRYPSEPSGKPPGPSRSMRGCASRRAHRAVHRAIRRASRCRGAAYDTVLKQQPAGATDTEPNPLDYSL